MAYESTKQFQSPSTSTPLFQAAYKTGPVFLGTLANSSVAEKEKRDMGSTSRAWVVAASIGAVEALKDQGICRWNFVVRSLHQHANANIRPFSQFRKLASQSSAAVSVMRDDKLQQSEESLRKVMYLSCWGPN